jgi:hypothetical protein
MIPVLSTAFRGIPPPPVTPSFGATADRINCLKPLKISYPTIAGSVAQTDAAANYINQWNAGDPSQDGFPAGTGPAYVSFSAPVAGPGGGPTAYQMIEVKDDIVPAYNPKPAPWALTGFDSKWTDFWTNAVCVVPCWEGSGSPHYYTAGGVLGPALTQVGTSTWGAVDGSSLHFATGANDWRIVPTGPVDFFPTTHATFLMVRKLGGTPNPGPGSPNWGFGMQANTGAGQIYFSYGISVVANLMTCGWSGANVANVASWPFTTTDVEIVAMVVGTTQGCSVYRKVASSPVQGVTMVLNSGTPGTRTQVNDQFGLTMSYQATGCIQQDVIFFACLGEEWTQTQVLTWMNDPYAPIRTDGGNPVPHLGKPSPHYAICGSNRIMRNDKLVLRFATFAHASSTRGRFKLEVSNGPSTYISARQTGVTVIFDIAGGQATTPVLFGGTLTGGSPTPVAANFTAGAAHITAVTGFPGWYYCTLDFTTNTGYNGTNGGVICYLTIDNGTGTGAESTVYAAPGGDFITLWQTRLLPYNAFALNNAVLFDDFLSTSTMFLHPGTGTFPPVCPAGFNWYNVWHWPANKDYPGYNPPNPMLGTIVQDPSTFTISGSVLKIVNMPPPTNAGLGLVSFGWNDAGGGSPDTGGQYPFPGGCVGNFFHPPAYFELKASFPDLPTAPANGIPAWWVVAVENYLQHDWFNPTTSDASSNWGVGSVPPGGGAALVEQFAPQVNAAVPIGGTVLPFNYVPTFFRKPGMRIYASNGAIPANTRVASFTTTSITLDTPVASPGIPINHPIHITWYVEDDFFELSGATSTDPSVAHFVYQTLIDIPGTFEAQAQPSGPTNNFGNGTVFHLHQHLWLSEVAGVQYGIQMAFYDGMFWDNTGGTIGGTTTKTYGANINGSSFTGATGAFTIADVPGANHFVMWITGNLNWPLFIDWVRVLGP